MTLVSCGGTTGEVRPPTGDSVDETSLGPGDVFDVRVYDESELSGTYRVERDGAIAFPFVGRVSVVGLDPSQVAATLATRLKEGGFLRSPQVSVFVQEYASKQVSVMGAVGSPGTFPVRSGMTVLQVITQAGGLTPLSDEDNTLVTRRVGSERTRFRVELSAVMQGRAEDVALRAGDIIYVPERVF